MNLLKRLFLVTILTLILLLGGTIVYSYLEGWNYLDSLYFTVVTITTIGYGDFAPQTDLGKIFTILFPFIGIAMIFYFFSIIGKYVIEWSFEKILKEHHEKIIRHLKPKLKEKRKRIKKR